MEADSPEPPPLQGFDSAGKPVDGSPTEESEEFGTPCSFDTPADETLQPEQQPGPI
jgi:hypothetical protein